MKEAGLQHSPPNYLKPSEKAGSDLARAWTPEDLGRFSQTDTGTQFPDLMTHFLLSCPSPHTRRNYSRDLKNFLDFCSSLGIEIRDIRDVKEKTVLLWKYHLEKSHTKFATHGRRIIQASVARPLCALSSLINFAMKRGLLDKNCVTLITRPKIKRDSKTNALTGIEVKVFLRTAEEEAVRLREKGGRSYASARLRYAVLYTLLSVGMRVDELCELRIGDLERTPQFTKLHMTAKGGEAHSPIIHKKTEKVILEYIKEFRSNAGNDQSLFVRAQRTHNTTKLTQSAIYKMISSLAKQCEIEKRLSPHSCRATLATLLHNKGVPIGQIQDLLNHKQITTTAIYLKKADELHDAAAIKIDILD